MRKDSIYESEYEEIQDGSMRKLLFQLSIASIFILAICVYITESFIVGYVSHVLLMTGLWSVVYIEELWGELTAKSKIIAVPISMIFLCLGFALILNRAYMLFQMY